MCTTSTVSSAVRGVSGGNILVTKSHVVKLADFGLIRRLPRQLDKMSKLGMRLLTPKVVTPWWRPPELFLGDERYTDKVDMWSVGALFGELLAGDVLFPGDNLDVLKKIFDHVGTPTAENWPGHDSLPYYMEVINVDYRRPPQLLRKLHDRFPRLAQ